MIINQTTNLPHTKRKKRSHMVFSFWKMILIKYRDLVVFGIFFELDDVTAVKNVSPLFNYPSSTKGTPLGII